MIADILAAVIYPIGAASFLLAAILLPLTFPDRQRWRFMLVWACLGLSAFSLLLAASTAPYAVLEFEATRLYVRISYGIAMCFLLPFMAVYFQRALALRVRLWRSAVGEWTGRQISRFQQALGHRPHGNGNGA